MYSGQQMLRNVDLLVSQYNSYNNDCKKVLDIHSDKSVVYNEILNSQFVVLVGYASDVSILAIQDYAKTSNTKIFIYRDKLIFNIYRLMENVIIPDRLGKIVDIMKTHFKAKNFNAPLYFDHKIAGEFSSFPELYNKLVKVLPSRVKVKELEKNLKDLGIVLPTC